MYAGSSSAHLDLAAGSLINKVNRRTFDWVRFSAHPLTDSPESVYGYVINIIAHWGALKGCTSTFGSKQVSMIRMTGEVYINMIMYVKVGFQ